MFTKFELAQGVHLYIKPTTQFKTVSFSIKWRNALTAKDAAERTVLTNVLQHSNAEYPTMAAFRSALDDLYGSVLYFDTAKRGAEHSVYLNTEVVNDQYLQENGVLAKMLEIMHAAIFMPNLEGEAFKKDIVEHETAMVAQRIGSIFDDKGRFAQQRLMQILRPNEPAAISANGTLDEVKAVTPQSLYNAYQKMMKNDAIDIYVVGDVDVNELAAQIKATMPFADRECPVIPTAFHKEPRANVGYVREQHTMKQGKLHLGFFTPVVFGDEDFAKMQIFNGIFGGYPHAKLFMNVREKESLAYYAGSSYASHYGLVFVTAGIEPSNEEKAYELIKAQLQHMRDGDITDLELLQTKAMLANQLREALDAARGQIEVYAQYKDLDPNFTAKQWAQKWQAVTKEDIIAMAKQVQLEAVYFLSGKEEA